MTRRLLLAMLLAPAALLAAQAPQTPARDAAALAPAGSATISGRLVTGGDERPVRRAIVRASVSGQPRVTATDDDGQFTLAPLPAGNYVIQASKPGFVTAYYGAKRPGRGPGVPVVVAGGQRVQIAMTMIKGAVIAGAVVDSNGRPAANAGLQLMQYRMVNGQRSLEAAYGGYGYASTDDRGYYRAFGLAPGEYLVAVTGRSYGSAGMHETTAAEIQWAERLFASPGSPLAAAPGAVPAGGPPVTAAPVYYPGTFDATRAEWVKVGPGEERLNVNFSIAYVPTASIEGVVVDSAGRPAASAQVSLVATSVQPGDFVMAMSSAGRATAVNGAFAMRGIAPGRYTVAARVSTSPAEALWAFQELVVEGRDVRDVTLRLEPGLSLAGRVVFEGTAPAPKDLSGLRINVVSMRTAAGVILNVPIGSIGADGSFTVSGLIPGSYRVTAAPAAEPASPAAWMAKSAMVGGRDALDVPVELASAPETPSVTITFTDRAAELSGTVLDADGRPTPEYSIVLFPTDRQQWLPNARRVRAVRLSSAGSFVASGLPAGEYYVSAANDFDPSDLADPAFLADLAAAAVRLTLGEGEKKRQDLKVR